ARQVSYHNGQFSITLDNDETVSAQHLLVAVGRRANLESLGLDNVGLDPHARALEVDPRMRVAQGIWAVGDITGHGQFTHMAMYQARLAADDILGKADAGTADYRAVSRVTFLDPEIGSVGLSTAQARERGLRVRTGMTAIPESTRGWIHKAGNDGFIKLVADA